MESTSSSARLGPVAPVAVVAGIVALIAAVLLVRGDVADLDPATPEGVVQGYLRAVLDGDHRAALTFLTPELADACRAEAATAAPSAARVTLDGTHVEGATAEVDVVLTHVAAPGPFESGSYSHHETLYLERLGDGWAISSVPWPLWNCEEAP